MQGGVEPAEQTPSLAPPLTPRQFQQVAELGPIMQDQGALAAPASHALTTPDVPQAPSTPGGVDPAEQLAVDPPLFMQSHPVVLPNISCDSFTM